MTMAPVATKDHVEEALRLFNVSTIDAINSGQIMTEQISDKAREELEQIEKIIKIRLARNSSTSVRKIVEIISQQVRLFILLKPYVILVFDA